MKKHLNHINVALIAALFAPCFVRLPQPAYGEGEDTANNGEPKEGEKANENKQGGGRENVGSGLEKAGVTDPANAPAAAPTTITADGITPLPQVHTSGDIPTYSDDWARRLLEEAKKIETVNADNYDDVRGILRNIDFAIEKTPDENVGSIFTAEKMRIHGMQQTYIAKQ